jgi:phosphopantothenoylcysteine decarboxylase/phosphopantothenate--cysteine ligase
MHFLITAGGTRETIDPVRFISNASSGRMGYTLARAALGNRHKVTLITAPTHLRPPRGATVINVITAKEMFLHIKEHFPACECLIMCAAVSDYTVTRPSRTKIKKSDQHLTIELKPTTDILRWAGRHRRRPVLSEVEGKTARPERNRREAGKQVIVGFALEDRDIKARAEEKLRDKNLDMIIANTPDAISADRSALAIKTPGRAWIDLPLTNKRTQARRIIRHIETLFESPNL